MSRSNIDDRTLALILKQLAETGVVSILAVVVYFITALLFTALIRRV